ncbi:cadmium-translocating P-type ATPase [Rhizobium cauense]|uniref:heavy metal translocating P-type ATPase n=1 Tax=Rhizobium cauense TaxID=1166683 RepID=UPI001C6E7CF1|nr:heavy metal translocating P-type ATPase [Rhizobium cauense]MBW9114733.1 cadmium-translocating P-type ATPase [Rhizobium cauense]
MQSIDAVSARSEARLSLVDAVKRHWPVVLFGSALGFLLIGLFLAVLGGYNVASTFFISSIVLVLGGLVAEIAWKVRKGDFGLDLIAGLAMCSALWFEEYLAGAIVSVMYAGGHFLEFYAHHRAESGMTELLSRVPRSAMRLSVGGFIEVPIQVIEPGDRLLIRRGDVVPVDGTVDGRSALVDQSALTGEPLPVRLEHGHSIASGASNAGEAFELVVSNTAGDSTYAHILRLVQRARNAKAPIYRLADKIGIWFLVLTLAIASISVAASGDPVRLLAVLVVATPCPLILAVPVALVAGMSNAARKGVLVKGAGVLEALSKCDTVIFDKTGTLTIGEPTVAAVSGTGAPNELLRLAASAELASAHPLGRAIVREARERCLPLSGPEQAAEVAGEGVVATVDRRRVLVGSPAFLRLQGVSSGLPTVDASATALVCVDDQVFGAIRFEDSLREEAAAAVEGLRDLGVKRILLASGDRMAVAKTIASRLRIDDVEADLGAADKVNVVQKEKARGGQVLMVGDGVNDAPALAAADVGLAVVRGNLAAAAEAADVVLLRGGLIGLVKAVEVSRRSMEIAIQSVVVGIGLSLVAMAFAGAGLLPPVQGALLQEAIDIAVVLNALRALR